MRRAARMSVESLAVSASVSTSPCSAQAPASAPAALRASVDVLIVVDNERLLSIVPAGFSLSDSFALADEVLRQGIVGLTDLDAGGNCLQALPAEMARLGALQRLRLSFNR